MDEAVLFAIGAEAEGAIAALGDIDAALASIEASIAGVVEASTGLDAVTLQFQTMSDAAVNAAIDADSLATSLAGLAGSAADTGAAEDGAATSTSNLSDAMWYLSTAVNNNSTMLEANTAAVSENAAALDKQALSAKAAGDAALAAGPKAEVGQLGFLAAVTKGGAKLKMLGLATAAAGIGFVYFGSQAETALNTIAALTGASAQDMQTYTAAAEAMSEKYGYSLKATADGMYYVISAGYKTADAINVLDVAMQAASAGNADLATVSAGLTKALNAYGAGADQAQHYSDLMIKAVTDGTMTFNDFAQNVSTFAIAGNQAKISFQQMAAAASTLSQSEPISIASTQLRFLLNSIQDAGKVAKEAQALGINGFDQAAFSSDNLLQKLQYLQQITGGNVTEFNKLVGGIRGTAAAHTLLTERTDKNGKIYYEFNRIMADMNNSTNATSNAFKTHTDTMKYSLDQLGATLSVTAYHFEQLVKPVVIGFFNGLRTAIQFLSTHAWAAIPVLTLMGVILGTVVLAGLTAATTAILGAIAPLGALAATIVTAVIPGLFGMAGAAIAATLPLLPLIVIIGGVIAIVVMIVTHLKELGRTFHDIGSRIHDFATMMGGLIDGANRMVLGVIGSVAALPMRVAAHLASMVVHARDTVSKLPGAVLGVLGNFFTSLPKKFADLAGNIAGAFVNAMKNLGGKIVEGITWPFREGLGALKGMLGIASPSRVFKDLGTNVGLGFIQGITGQTAGVSRAVLGMVAIPGGAGAGAAIRLPGGALPTRVGGISLAGGGSGAGALGSSAAQATAAQTNNLLAQAVALLGQISQKPAGGGPNTTIGDINQTIHAVQEAGFQKQRAANLFNYAGNLANRIVRAGGVRTRGNIGGHPLA